MDFETKNSRIFDFIWSCLIFIWATGYCLYFGSVGYVPMDHPTVFDCGWRIYCGQVPFRDFVTSTAIVPGLMQAVLFNILGVNWLCFCLHAALLNGVFCVLGYSLLRIYACPRWFAVIASCETAILFYTPHGVPNMDQHAFFFCFATLWCQLVAPRLTEQRLQKTVLAVGCFSLGLAAFSKHVPTVFFIPFIVVFAFLSRGQYRFNSLRWIGRCFLVFILTAGLCVCFWRVPLYRVQYYMVNLSYETAEGRTGGLLERGKTVVSLLAFYRLTWWCFLISLGLLLFSKISILVLRRNGPSRFLLQSDRQNLWFAIVALYISSWGAVFISNDQKENSIPFMFLIPAIAYASIAPVFFQWLESLPKGYFRRLIRYGGRLVVTCGLGWYAIVGWRAHFKINVQRVCHDTERIKTWEDFKSVRRLGGTLWPMGWLVPDSQTYGAEDFLRLVDFCKKTPGGIVLFGQNSLVYGLSGKFSVMPNLVFGHPAYFPRRQDMFYWNDFEQLTLNHFEKYRPQYLIIEPANHYLNRLDQVNSLVTAHLVRTFWLGPFQILELSWR